MGNLIGETWTPPGESSRWELFENEAFQRCGPKAHIYRKKGAWVIRYPRSWAAWKIDRGADRDDRLVVEELERRANTRALPSAQSEVDALFPVSKADGALLAHVQTLNQRLFRVKVALWSAGALGLVELAHLLHH